jgi:cell division septal protein FtsQ
MFFFDVLVTALVIFLLASVGIILACLLVIGAVCVWLSISKLMYRKVEKVLMNRFGKLSNPK